MRKCAQIFLTHAPGSFDVDVRGLGRVLEDGNVTWEYSQKLSERTGYPRWEVSWKLTIDLIVSIEFRQVREVLQNADVACEGAGKIREG